MLKKIVCILVAFAIGLIVCSCGSETGSSSASGEKTAITDDDIKEIIEEASMPESKFIRLLFELEENVGWEAVDSSWRDRRMAWGEEYFEETSATKQAEALLEFESILTWESVVPEWENRREDWVADVKSAANEGELAEYLVELESYIRWESVGPDWQYARPEWIASCESLAVTDGGW
jgi:hypothetical protein